MATSAFEWNAPDGTPLIRVRLSNGEPAYTRGGFVTQAMIDKHGSYQSAREALRNKS